MCSFHLYCRVLAGLRVVSTVCGSFRICVAGDYSSSVNPRVLRWCSWLPLCFLLTLPWFPEWDCMDHIFGPYVFYELCVSQLEPRQNFDGAQWKLLRSVCLPRCILIFRCLACELVQCRVDVCFGRLLVGGVRVFCPGCLRLGWLLEPYFDSRLLGVLSFWVFSSGVCFSFVGARLTIERGLQAVSYNSGAPLLPWPFSY